ncbi:MAG: hypothetical protein FAF04_08270 [Epsilonproteobacteria bacterium]|nr:hypothetical protein [Campylobacterota bacterium]
MRDNPFANRKTVYYDLSDMDNIVKYEDSDRKKQAFFEVPLLFMYKNEITGSFAQFELEDVSPESTPLEAIEIFMQRVLEFGKVDAKPLPQELLASLTDAEVDLFLLAHVENYYYEKIRELIYIQKQNDYYQDRFGFTYYIAAVGVKEAVLWFEQNDEMLTLHTTPEQLQDSGDKLYVTRDNSAEHRVNVENFYEE